MPDVLTSLAMPLRDAARLLRTATFAAEPVFRPTAKLLPDAVVELVERAIARADDMGDQVLTPPLPGPEDIAAARALLTGEEGGSRLALTRTVAFGLTALLPRFEHEHAMVSESALALITGDATPRGDVGESMARVCRAIVARHVVLVPDGLSLGSDALPVTFATLLWLSLDRNGEQDEIRLLHLAANVTHHVEASLRDADDVALAALFVRLAPVI
ncbi:MAG: hypothetical protein AAGF30_10725 [Pseudomonadota bacterium]